MFTLPRLVQVAALALLVALALRTTQPPMTRRPANDAEFSLENAMAHVRAIAVQPHPTGSAANDQVRAYLLDHLERLGLHPAVQAATVRDRYGNAITLHNVLARLPAAGGDESGAKRPAILLVAHYDSVSRGPGAGDDTAAVAALLETMRALREMPGLKTDVQLLITDGEEMGLLGAQGFCAQTNANGFALVLNFDARGTTGASIMYETGPGNLGLIRHFAAAAPFPIANSLAYDVSRLLPNSSDFRIFRRAGLKGLNFAFIGNYYYYHTKNDTVENLNPASVYHDGMHALSLTRHFALMDAAELAAMTASDQPDAIYFNLTPSLLICYSASWVWPLTPLLIVMTIAMLAIGFRRRQLTLLGLGGAFARLVLALLVPTAAVCGLMLVLHDAQTPGGFIGRLLTISTLSIVITMMLMLELRRRTTGSDLAATGVILFALLAIPVNLYVPGGSFLFTWPPLFLALGVLAATLLPPVRWLMTAVVIVALAPAAILFTPLVVQLFTALTLQLAWACSVGVTLTTWLIVSAMALGETKRLQAFPSDAAPER
jgi:hypothetical protein